MVVISDGVVVYEDYALPIDKFISWKIYSGTKGLTAVLAAAAVKNGVIDGIDGLAADYLPEWKQDPVKSTVTIRQLLSLTSGIATPTIGEGETLTFAAAVELPFHAEPGATFEWGAGAYQVFGEIVRRALVAKGYAKTDPMTFLNESVLRPIRAGTPLNTWTKSPDGYTHLSAGARMSARSWALVGSLILSGGAHRGMQLLDPDVVARLSEGTAANPGFGFGWGNPTTLPAEMMAEGGVFDAAEIWLPDPDNLIPDDLMMSAGAGRQRMYIVPSLELVVVRQSLWGYEGFDDREFWRLLLAPPASVQAK